MKAKKKTQKTTPTPDGDSRPARPQQAQTGGALLRPSQLADARSREWHLSMKYVDLMSGRRADWLGLYRLARELLELIALYRRHHAASSEAGCPVETFRPVPPDVVDQWRAARAELESIYDRNQRDLSGVADLIDRLISLCETVRPVSRKRRPKARKKDG